MSANCPLNLCLPWRASTPKVLVFVTMRSSLFKLVCDLAFFFTDTLLPLDLANVHGLAVSGWLIGLTRKRLTLELSLTSSHNGKKHPTRSMSVANNFKLPQLLIKSFRGRISSSLINSCFSTSNFCSNGHNMLCYIEWAFPYHYYVHQLLYHLLQSSFQPNRDNLEPLEVQYLMQICNCQQ